MTPSKAPHEGTSTNESRNNTSPDDEDETNQSSSSGGEQNALSGNGSSGSGSGHGYIADGSSSDSSSDLFSNGGKFASSAALHNDNPMINIDRLSLQAAAGAETPQEQQATREQRMLKDPPSRSRIKLPLPPSMEIASAVMPQYNGVRIQHPMDPRIDLSTVGYVNTDKVALPPPAPELGNNEGAVKYDHYFSLLEAVQPFFSLYTPTEYPQGSHAAAGAGAAPVAGTSDGTQGASSEGFTSFFTTTHTGTSDSNSNSNGEQVHSTRHGTEANAGGATTRPGDESDTSSMKVQARVKRRHKQRASSQDMSQAQEDRLGVQGDGRLNNYAAVLDLNNDSSRADAQPQAPLQQQQQQQQGPLDDIRADMQHFPVPVPPRIVSESSDNLARQSQEGFSSTTNTGTTNTSGSGSGGNSGSNNNSSGSGNENSGSGVNSGHNSGNNNSSGSGNEDKSGASPVQEGISISVETNGEEAQRETPEVDLMMPPSAVARSNHQRSVRSFPPPLYKPQQGHTANEKDPLREQKILDKKRKRMNMRREYEEQVERQLNSSDSSESYAELMLRPGQAVALDEVLSFSKRPRMIVQATPPHLVVYANAAYTGLTGVDSHAMIGRPISGLLSLLPPPSLITGPDGHQKLSPSNGTEQTVPAAMMPTGIEALAATVTTTSSTGTNDALPLAHDDMSVERLVVASGYAEYNVVNVVIRSPPQHSGNGESHASSPSGETREDIREAMLCRVCISPIASAKPPNQGVVTDSKDNDDSFAMREPGAVNHHASKRRKHHHYHAEANSHLQSLITHYVIQLEQITSENNEQQQRPDDDGPCASLKNTVQADVPIAPPLEGMEEDADSSDRTAPVSAVG